MPALILFTFFAELGKLGYLQAQFYRIKARRGPKKAIMAVAASILTAILARIRKPDTL
jgi:transposase